MIIFLTVLVLLFVGCSGLAAAGPLEEYEEAQDMYLYAAVCRGSYSDRLAKMVARALSRDGWQVESNIYSTKDVDVKYLLARKDVPGKGPVYLVGIAGTESGKDRKVDLSFGKVYFAGSTVEEHGANAAVDEKAAPPGAPLVHRGFLRYVQTAVTLFDPEEKDTSLLNELLRHPDRKVYLVGHSLGGAVATLGGAYLLDLGVRPEQIEVVTFGAPPVGNAAFAQKYENVLNLNRIVISGDPVTGVLQTFVGGYKLFGKQTVWNLEEDYLKIHHTMALYLDYAVKQCYQKQQLAEAAGLLKMPNEKQPAGSEPKIYVAPVQNALPEEMSREFGVMQEVLLDEYRTVLPGYLLDRNRPRSGDGNVQEYLQQAADAGCQGLIVPVITATRVKEERNTYYVTLYQRVYRVGDRSLLAASAMGSNTRKMTPLEALEHGALEMTESSGAWLPLLAVPSQAAVKAQ